MQLDFNCVLVGGVAARAAGGWADSAGVAAGGVGTGGGDGGAPVGGDTIFCTAGVGSPSDSEVHQVLARGCWHTTHLPESPSKHPSHTPNLHVLPHHNTRFLVRTRKRRQA